MTRLIDADAIMHELWKDAYGVIDPQDGTILAIPLDDVVHEIERSPTIGVTESEKRLQTICNIQMENLNTYQRIFDILRKENEQLSGRVKVLEAELNQCRQEK